jgi:hypothetical protein
MSRTLVFFPCVAGCEASRESARYCTCRCRGLNHGRLWRNEPARPYTAYREDQYGPVNVTPETSYGPVINQEPYRLPNATLALPEIKKKPVITSTFSVFRVPSVKRKVARRIAKAIGFESQDSKNDRILSAMRKQFPGEKLDAIIEQAFSVYYSRNGPEANRPELYELYENSDIDTAIEHFGARWVIGRPKTTS